MIKPERKTIEDLLNRGSVVYAIPEYQRNFEWKKENAEELLDDIETGNLFIGTLIFDISGGNTLLIVDGQQRMTTIFILLSAMREQAKLNGNLDQAKALQDKISFRDRDGRVEGPKLIVSEKIREVFEGTITNENWDGNTYDFKNRKRQINKIKPLFDTFFVKLSQFNESEFSEFRDKLYESYAVIIEIENTEEAFDIFERTNSRGMNLNAADLLKNYLFSKLDLNSEEIKKRWETIIDRSAGNILRMIKHFYVSKSGYITKRDLFKNLKVRGENGSPEKLLEEIDLFTKHYTVIVDGTENTVLEWAVEFDINELRKEYNYQQLNRSLDALNLFGVAQSYPLIAKVMELVSQVKREKDRNMAGKSLIKFVRNLENFHFINSAVSQKQANIVEKFYAESCAQNIEPSTVVSFMESVIKNLKNNKLATESEFITSFSNINYESDFTLIYYINDRMNDFTLDPSNPSSIYNPDRKILKRNHSIDHLISQSSKNYDFKIDSDLEQNIGNLLVITTHLNSRLNDVHIEKKLKIMNDETTNLPEIKKLIKEWSNKDWSSAEKIQENIAERNTRIAKECFNKVFAITI